MTHAVITVTELAQKLTDGAKLCIVDCRFDPMNPAAGQQAYLAGHIPGAHYAHLENDLSAADKTTGGRHPIPSPEEFTIRQAWLFDPEMMAYNAGWPLSYAGYNPATGCIDWPEGAWPAFEARLARPASEQGYYFVQEDETSEFLGHVHYELHSDGTAHIGLNVIPARRGTGLGMRFMNHLLERIWQDTEGVC